MDVIARPHMSDVNTPTRNNFKITLKVVLKILGVMLIIGWMSLYPIYNSYYKANGVEHYERHLDHIAGKSMFFNPWQYRVLCPWIIEGLYWVADNTIFAVIEIKGLDVATPGEETEKNERTVKLISGLKNAEFVKYTLVFVAFRIIQNLVIFYLCFIYFSHFIRSKNLVLLGLMMCALFMGNGVIDADLTFNTYMDVTLYLLAAIVIVKNYSPYWIILITFIGALNRETSLLIPVLYFFTKVNVAEFQNVPLLIQRNLRSIVITASALLIFVATFILVRNFYGYQPVAVWRVSAGWDMIKLNLISSVSVKTYMEFFGVFGFLPLWCFLIYNRLNYHLRVFFIFLVPIWFVIHLSTAMGSQTRLYLVPTLLVLLPAILSHIEEQILTGREVVSS